MHSLGVGLEFKLARIRAGLKQCEVAHRAGIHPVMLCLYEGGRRQPSSELAASLWQIVEAARAAKEVSA